LRWVASVLAFGAVLSAVWMVNQAVRETDASNQAVLHTQQVLDQLETVLAKLLAAEGAVLGQRNAPGAVPPDALAVADTAIADEIGRLAALIADNSSQRSRVDALRETAARISASLRGLAAATEPANLPAAAVLQEAAGMDAARTILRDMRIEEDRLLRLRTETDRLSIRRLQIVTACIAVAAMVLLGIVLWLFGREARHHEGIADELRQTTADLRGQVGDRTADFQAVNARLQSIIDSAVDGIVVIDARGRIESFNRSAERLFGYASDEVVGHNVKMLMPSPYHEEHDGYVSRYLETGARRIIGLGRQVSGLRRDGTTFPLHLSVGELTVDGERKFTGILHDLSIRVQMEEQIREQATLVRLGEMAAVLAHEVKNPLAGIRGAIQVVGARLPKESREAAVIGDIVSRIDGLNELMKDLLLFARPPQLRRAPVELGPLVTTTAELLGRDPAFKELEIRVDGAGALVDADPELLKIVFVNLMINGAHAMRSRGTIHVSLHASNGQCQVAFIDQGPGIPADVREKIFQPFFTTKARGTGLGLPTAKRLIEAHGGTIAISCPTGGGTTVTVSLPASPQPAAV
jgi:two-component system sensor kinase FixL